MDLERKKEIIEKSNSIKGFNKEMFNFLCKGSAGCLAGHYEFESACMHLNSGVPVEYVKLWFEIKDHLEGIFTSEDETMFFALLQSEQVKTNDLSFLLEGNFNRDQLNGFLLAFKNKLPKEKINLLQHVHLHPTAIDFFIRYADKITPEKVNRVIQFHEELGRLKQDHLDVVLGAIICFDFSNEQIKALIEEKFEFDFLFKLFKAGLSAKDATESFDILKHSDRYLIMEALKEKVDSKKIIKAAKLNDYIEMTNMIARARKNRINKEFEELLKKYN